jgi:hypothetical protein
MRMLANVPRTITSWLPRRAPYWLKSISGTPGSIRYLPAGLLVAIEPAGEMWSVVTLSPRYANAFAPTISLRVGACGWVARSRKYGASDIGAVRVELIRRLFGHRHRVPHLVAREDVAVLLRNMSGCRLARIVWRISSCVGQMSRR